MQRKDGSKLKSLRLELRESQLTKRGFASQIGVDLTRLEYWLQLEAYQDQSQRDLSSDAHRIVAEEDATTLVVAGEFELRVPNGLDAAHLGHILQALSDVTQSRRPESSR